MLPDIALVASDTTRSRIYAQALIAAGLLPSVALILENRSGISLPGQAAIAGATKSCRPEWARFEYDLSEPLADFLSHGGVPVISLGTHDINSALAISGIAARPEGTLVYSGYGGVLLGPKLLALGKNFLHVHGGYLPDYKGSTTNYYNLLTKGVMGASAIFLTMEIDSGPVLQRRKFAAPPERSAIDHVWDSAARAEVLVDTLAAYVKNGRWDYELEENIGGQAYYVIHPVLKHLAILAEN